MEVDVLDGLVALLDVLNDAREEERLVCFVWVLHGRRSRDGSGKRFEGRPCWPGADATGMGPHPSSSSRCCVGDEYLSTATDQCWSIAGDGSRSTRGRRRNLSSSLDSRRPLNDCKLSRTCCVPWMDIGKLRSLRKHAERRCVDELAAAVLP